MRKTKRKGGERKEKKKKKTVANGKPLVELTLW